MSIHKDNGSWFSMIINIKNLKRKKESSKFNPIDVNYNEQTLLFKYIQIKNYINLPKAHKDFSCPSKRSVDWNANALIVLHYIFREINGTCSTCKLNRINFFSHKEILNVVKNVHLTSKELVLLFSPIQCNPIKILLET